MKRLILRRNLESANFIFGLGSSGENYCIGYSAAANARYAVNYAVNQKVECGHVTAYGDANALSVRSLELLHAPC